MGGEEVEDTVWCKPLSLREGMEVMRVDKLSHLLSEVE